MIKKSVLLLLSLMIMLSSFASFDVSAESELEVPRITLTTEDGNGVNLKKSDGYVNATVNIENIDGTTLCDNVVMKVRGNSTAFDSIKKKSYNFKFSKKKNVLNMGSGKKWALISNVYDPTLARNYVALSIAKELGIQYTSDFKVVEVVVDGSFRGCYLLVEPIGTGKDRVDIDVDDNNGKNDFLVELEATRVEDDVKYFTSNGLRFAVSEPDPPDDEQLSYIQSTMDEIINTIRNGTKEEIESKIDVESFTKFYLLNEYLKTVDFNFSSVFFYYKDGKLYAGPPWDYDLSSGNVNEKYSSWYASSYKTDGLFAKNYNLYKWLCQKSWFNDLAKNELSVHCHYFANIASENSVIDNYYNTYKNVINRNFTTAGWKPGTYYVNVMKVPLATYQDNYDFYVNWCKERSEWLINYFEAEPIPNPRYEQLIEQSFSPDASDSNVNDFGLYEGFKYKGLDLLGVQLKSKNINANAVKFVGVISSELLAKASDYGFVFTKTDKSTQEAKENADKLTVENGHIYSCLDTKNTMTGDYGDPESDTSYKYVTIAINNIEDNLAFVGRFYVVIEGVTYYAEYTDSSETVYNGCAGRLSDFGVNFGDFIGEG